MLPPHHLIAEEHVVVPVPRLQGLDGGDLRRDAGQRELGLVRGMGWGERERDWVELETRSKTSGREERK